MEINIEILKEECIKILDSRGWDDKSRVDLRDKSSMLSYLKFYEVRGY